MTDSDTRTGKRRLARGLGVVALVLGTTGALLAIATSVALGWSALTASRTVDGFVDDVGGALGRLDARLDAATDAATTGGGELEARLDGLTDVASAARRSVDAVEDHPLYGNLPSRFSSLRDRVVDIEEQVAALRSKAGAELGEAIASLQETVAEVNTRVDNAGTSLRRWIWLAMAVGVLLALWVLWGQVTLARRGWRGTKGQAPKPPSSN